MKFQLVKMAISLIEINIDCMYEVTNKCGVDLQLFESIFLFDL